MSTGQVAEPPMGSRGVSLTSHVGGAAGYCTDTTRGRPAGALGGPEGCRMPRDGGKDQPLLSSTWPLTSGGGGTVGTSGFPSHSAGREVLQPFLLIC